MPHFFPLLESHGTKLVPVGVCTLESYIQYTPLGVYELSVYRRVWEVATC